MCITGWSWLLSRKNLVRASSQLREICGACSVLYPSGTPSIVSACLVSTEPDSCLRLMADRFTPDERFSQASIQSHLHTPRDVSATHILVFPTSATTQVTALRLHCLVSSGMLLIFLLPSPDPCSYHWGHFLFSFSVVRVVDQVYDVISYSI